MGLLPDVAYHQLADSVVLVPATASTTSFLNIVPLGNIATCGVARGSSSSILAGPWQSPRTAPGPLGARGDSSSFGYGIRSFLRNTSLSDVFEGWFGGGSAAPDTALPIGVRHRNTTFLTFGKPFVEASATNSYDNGENPMFSAKRALDPGGGYWVSDGMHSGEDVISVTLKLHHRHRSSGVRINWAYAPGMVRVRYSSDGEHFGDSICWRKLKNPEEAFEEQIPFDRPRNIMAVRIDMKQPRAYKYFGINQAALF